ncbi:GNAT family N-acetyltransferase [Sphaerospermopsis torques-reginae]|uniref:GNAT family N-acetyltransferase n=1 Tax=Sphaerospermopsis torques-reginae ITEP-024 TaxID=984208 RepID=A0ABX8X005_9CYAN|nr:GNAT family N-acetyltransferase [Sphaerospermopsis torques-reginae]QYX31893.1 GNAT family N-acetyltransferase [Sphaerospermopsis torques-reginae ITEP-024]
MENLIDSSDAFKHYLIEPLGKKHNRAAFCCGVDKLDNYFQKHAGQDARKRMAAPFVLVEKSSGNIAGFYTLSSTSIKLEELPIEITKKLPKYPLLPATLLGRLAVDQNHRQKGLGEMLLIDALYRSLQSEIATLAVVVEAKDDQARSFYEHYQFSHFPDYYHRLFLMMDTIEKMLA